MENPGKSEELASLEKAQIIVAGMTCDHCVRRVETALRKHPGVQSVRVDRASSMATVMFDSKETTVSQLHAVVRTSGYQPG